MYIADILKADNLLQRRLISMISALNATGMFSIKVGYFSRQFSRKLWIAVFLSCNSLICITAKVDFSTLNEDEQELLEKHIKRDAFRLLKGRVYLWQPIEYTTYVGKQYLVNRMAAEYSVLDRIFLEIANRCPDFKAHSLFDFGSGVGTVTW